MSQQNHYVYEFGPFHLDATKRVLLKQGEPLKLFPKEFDTLLALVERSGELLEKDELHVSATADGRYMVFQSTRSGGYEVWRARIDGNDLKQLTSGGQNREPHVSPDGKWVAYTSIRNGLPTLWRVTIDGGEPVQLTDKPSSGAAISHDGKYIACAFTIQANSRAQLAIIPADGGSPLKLFDLPRLANFSLGGRWTLTTRQ